VYFQQYWHDRRLAHNESHRVLIRDENILNKIWHPDIYFANARTASFHNVTQANFVIWIEPDGGILYDSRCEQASDYNNRHIMFQSIDGSDVYNVLGKVAVGFSGKLCANLADRRICTMYKLPLNKSS
jgi:hypothetical protein